MKNVTKKFLLLSLCFVITISNVVWAEDSQGGTTTDILTFNATEVAFVRDGSHANENYYSTNVSSGHYFIKNDNEGYNRQALLKFDISDLDIQDVNSINLSIKIIGDPVIYDPVANPELYISAYACTNDWNEQTVVYNNIGNLNESDFISRNQCTAKGIFTIDITDYIIGQKTTGNNTISLRIVASCRTKSEIDVNALKDLNTIIVEKTVSSEDSNKISYDELLTAAQNMINLYNTTNTGNNTTPGDPTIPGEGEAFTSTVNAIAAAYVRDGSNANNNYNADVESSGFLELKKDNEGYNRHALLKFDISDLEIEGANSIALSINIYCGTLLHASTEGQELYISAYKCPNTWEEGTVKYNTLSAMNENDLIGQTRCIQDGILFIDITNYIIEQKTAGNNTISLRLVASTKTNSQMELFADYSENTITARGQSVPFGVFYNENFTGNQELSNVLWEYAQDIYDSWYGRYQEIIAAGDYDADLVTVDNSEYTLNVSAQMLDRSTKVYTSPTRLVSTLNGYDEVNDVELDVYGGIIADDTHEATGHYYTKLIDGRWWLIDPLGNRCHITGLNHVTYAYDHSAYQTAAANRVFGSIENWANETTSWLKDDLGFNIGCNSGGSVNAGNMSMLLDIENGLGTIAMTHGIGKYAVSLGTNSSIGGATTFLYNNTMPAFDPGFVINFDNRINVFKSQFGDNPRIAAYSSDNELPIDDMMLTKYLTLDYSIEANYYSYACAWTWIKNITGLEGDEIDIYNIDNYSQSFGTDLFDLFKGFVYDRYYSVTEPIIDNYYPNSLYAGVRLLIDANKWEWISRITGYWCDILCINYYRVWEIDPVDLQNLAKWSGSPMMITEFYSKGMDAIGSDGLLFPNTDGAGWCVANQTERGYFYQNYTLRLLEAKNCIGWLYFQYIDNDPLDTSIGRGASFSNKGIVNSDHDQEIYSDLTEQMALIHLNRYSLIEFFDNRNN